MESFRTSIFEKSVAKTRRRQLYNLGIFGAIIAIWVFCFVGVAITYGRIHLGLISAIGLTVVLVGMKMYDDKYMGITAYGDRKGNLIIGRKDLEIDETRIPYAEMTNLVIYIEEYLGKPKELFNIHHGGNNLIEFVHKGKAYSVNYIIKNKEDYNRISRLVAEIEKDPELAKHLKQI